MWRRDLIKLRAGVAALSACGSTAKPSKRPTSVVTRWDTDPWARALFGASAGHAVLGARGAQQGGHRGSDHPGRGVHRYRLSGHGARAYMSGQRAANRLLAKLPQAQSVVVIGQGWQDCAPPRCCKTRKNRDGLGGSGSGRWPGVHGLLDGCAGRRGASWIHAVTGNPMVPVVRSAGLTLVASDYDDMVVRDYRTGKRATGVAAAETQLWRAMTAIGNSRPPKEAQFQKHWPSKAGPPTPPGAGSFSTASSTFVRAATRAARSPSAVGGQGVPRWGCPGPGRFQSRAGISGTGLGRPAEHPVERIVVEEGVRAGQIVADAAVVAVPLAVLQQNRPALPWPGRLRTYLDALTTGNLEKVFLRYEKQWWPDRQILGVLNAPGLRWSQWYNLIGLVDAPVIFGFCGGTSAWSRPGTTRLWCGRRRQ